MLRTWLEKPNLHNRMQAQRSLRETDNSTAACKGRANTFVSSCPKGQEDTNVIFRRQRSASTLRQAQ
jgi:hypothetical protein